MNYLGLIFLLSCIFSRYAYAGYQNDELLHGSFDTFVKQVVPSEDREAFKNFYSDLISEHNNKKKANAQKWHQKNAQELLAMRKLGWKALEVRNQELAQQIELIFDKKDNNAIQQKANMLLVRFGAYETFVTKKVKNKNSIITKTKSYVVHIGNKIGQWMHSLKRTRTA